MSARLSLTGLNAAEVSVIRNVLATREAELRATQSEDATGAARHELDAIASIYAKLAYTKPFKLGFDRIDELVRRYEAGESGPALAKEYGVSPAAVVNYVRRAGGTVRPVSRLTPAEAAELVRRYEAGESGEDLARAYGTNGATARRYIRRAGVRIRQRVAKPKPPPRGVQRKHDPATVMEIARRYEAGETGRSLAAEYKISRGTVRNYHARWLSKREGSE